MVRARRAVRLDETQVPGIPVNGLPLRQIKAGDHGGPQNKKIPTSNQGTRMNYFDTSMAPLFRQRLASRAAELRRALDGQIGTAASADAHEVSDFKDAASDESLAAVSDVQAAPAAAELDQVVAAERRLADGTFGQCVDCGEPIDLTRLTAMPATPCCVACQSIRERAQAT
jgi:DnaK suppressor protein